MATSHKQAAEEQAQESTGIHVSMHRDHLLWTSDAAEWQDDIAEWERQAHKVRSGLKELQNSLEEHLESLVKQSEEIMRLSQERATHEHALAEYERGGTAGDLVPDAAKHQKLAESYEQLRITHERAKQWHRSLVSQWEHLHKAIFGTPGI